MKTDWGMIALGILIINLSFASTAMIPEVQEAGISKNSYVTESWNNFQENADNLIPEEDSEEETGIIGQAKSVMGGEVFGLGFTLLTTFKWFFTFIISIFTSVHAILSGIGIPSPWPATIQGVLDFIMAAGIISTITGRRI